MRAVLTLLLGGIFLLGCSLVLLCFFPVLLLLKAKETRRPGLPEGGSKCSHLSG